MLKNETTQKSITIKTPVKSYLWKKTVQSKVIPSSPAGRKRVEQQMLLERKMKFSGKTTSTTIAINS